MDNRIKLAMSFVTYLFLMFMQLAAGNIALRFTSDPWVMYLVGCVLGSILIPPMAAIVRYWWDHLRGLFR